MISENKLRMLYGGKVELLSDNIIAIYSSKNAIKIKVLDRSIEKEFNHVNRIRLLNNNIVELQGTEVFKNSRYKYYNVINEREYASDTRLINYNGAIIENGFGRINLLDSRFILVDKVRLVGDTVTVINMKENKETKGGGIVEINVRKSKRLGIDTIRLNAETMKLELTTAARYYWRKIGKWT